MYMDLSLNTPILTKQAGNTCMEHVFGHGCQTMDPKKKGKVETEKMNMNK